LCAPAGSTRADEVGAAGYLHVDTNDTLVVAPRLRATVDVSPETKATAIYAVDVWTSASIDIVTSASQTPVTEQRDEIDLSIDHEFPDVTLTAAYRLSVEPDYVSNGGSGGFSYDFAQNNATIAVGLSGSYDDVGRAGDPGFSRPSSTLGGRLSFTQVLDVDTVAQVMYEISRLSGYLSSPYRYVAIGTGWGCATPAPVCVPEVNPGERLRHAASLSGRRSMGSEWSLGGAYRFYTDDWGILSHTISADATWLLSPETLLSGRYRFYTQGAADHYEPIYTAPQEYVTSDKELSSLSSHRVTLELEHVFELTNARTLTATASVAPIFYFYSDFPPLDQITAFEANLAFTLGL
jgi:hypothetical protein